MSWVLSMLYLLFVTFAVYHHDALSGLGCLHLVIILDVLVADGAGRMFGESVIPVKFLEVGFNLFFFQSVKPPTFV